jgi:hypothetical protein
MLGGRFLNKSVGQTAGRLACRQDCWNFIPHRAMTSTENINPLLQIYILTFPGIIGMAVTQGSAAACNAIHLFSSSQ